MKENLLIKLGLEPNCSLIAVDKSPYESWEEDLTGHVILEFVLYNEERSPRSGKVSISDINTIEDYYILRYSHPIYLDKDGN